ncbi:MAG: hypothetical protein AVDCRST_MAG54-3504, partial [uncultured Actinomycetospora sp.]
SRPSTTRTTSSTATATSFPRA